MPSIDGSHPLVNGGCCGWATRCQRVMGRLAFEPRGGGFLAHAHAALNSDVVG
jgi:hypothetical protein